MSRVYWIEHKGKQVLFADYSNLGVEELISVLAEVNATLPNYQHLPPQSILVLADFTGAIASKETVSAVKKTAALWRPLYKKQAVIGLTPLQHLFVTAVNKFSGTDFKAFGTKKDALAWLVSD